MEVESLTHPRLVSCVTCCCVKHNNTMTTLTLNTTTRRQDECLILSPCCCVGRNNVQTTTRQRPTTTCQCDDNTASTRHDVETTTQRDVPTGMRTNTTPPTNRPATCWPGFVQVLKQNTTRHEERRTAASLCQDWLICAPVAFLRIGSRCIVQRGPEIEFSQKVMFTCIIGTFRLSFDFGVCSDD